MRKTLVGLIVLGALIPAGLSAVSKNKGGPERKSPITSQVLDTDGATPFGRVLQAHNVKSAQSVSAFIGDASRLTMYDDSNASTPRFFERTVSVSTDGVAFRCEKIDPSKVREEFAVFDGKSLRSGIVEAGAVQNERPKPDGSDLSAGKLYVTGFGLAPVLKRLVELKTPPTYLGSTLDGDKFQVVTPAGSWNFYTDDRHLIRRLELGGKTVDYSDYRWVNGVNLPFFQRDWEGNRLICELVFNKLVLNPAFPSGYFAGLGSKL